MLTYSPKKGYPSRRLLFELFVALFIGVASISISNAQTVGQPDQAPRINLKTYIQQIQEQTPFMFLYREALINGISIQPAQTFENDEWLVQLRSQLESHNINVEVDSARHQIYLSLNSKTAAHEEQSPVKPTHFSGRVVDASSGEKLPFASVFWGSEANPKGTSADKEGEFRFKSTHPKDTLTITAGYVGYQRQKFEIPLAQSSQSRYSDITLRLKPESYQGQAVYIRAQRQTAGIDTVMDNLMELGKWNPLGESNTIRTLQLLPAVSQQSALNDGVHVRGSSPSGFNATLDDMPIYNTSHLFGLVDSFNADALQTSALYYDVIPASEGNATGGLLALNTRSGSFNEFKGTGGFSNSAVRATIEGPVNAFSSNKSVGQWSWLLAGRVSYMNQLNWLGNQSMLKYGLNLDRDHNLVDDLSSVEDDLINISGYDAGYHDIHGRLHYESNTNHRLNISIYSGGDNASIWGARLRGSANSMRPPNDNARVKTTALYNWANHLTSVNYSLPLFNRARLTTNAGFSLYDSEYYKDDFLYLRRRPTEDNSMYQFHAFEQDNRLETWKFQSNLSFHPSYGSWDAGAQLKHHSLDYSENTLLRSSYSQNFTSNEWAAFLQFETSAIPNSQLESGLRLQYYSDGRYLNLAPRFRFTHELASDLEANLGYSYNTQYLNLLTPPNSTGINIWIPATSNQPPTGAHQSSLGLSWNINSLIDLNVEGYYKKMKHVRLHELTDRFASEALSGAPWYYNNSGISRGVEFMANVKWHKLLIEQTYTLAHVTLENPAINGGNPYHPDWYRKHRYGLHITYSPRSNLSLFSSLNLASGAAISHWLEEENVSTTDQNRLSPYYRIDTGLTFKFRISQALLKVNAMVFNLTDHTNEWYREEIVVPENVSGAGRRSFTTVQANIYDLGFQPSFDVSLHW